MSENGMPVYESHPPAWLLKAHGSADLGYSGFHPPRPGQDEDVMSQTNIKNGFVVGDSVPAETFSAQDMIKSRFTHHEALTELEDLMNDIFIRRADHAPAIPPSSFRMPSRVTLNDSKRQAWFDDLANPDVPLHKLGKNVPHGAKGHDLLDLLQANDVAIPRAVWFLRVFGANETAGLRNKPSYNPTQYSIDWANVVTSYIKKQLADIALPSAPRPGLNIKQTFKGVLGDSDSRERWVSRFTYCLRLLRTFYSQGLVDNKTFLVWVVQTMVSCNLAQAGFVARLADEYLSGVLLSRALAKPFVDACLAKLLEIQSTAAHEYLPNLEALLKSLLQRVCLALPDAFVCAKSWALHSDLITEILTTDLPSSGDGARGQTEYLKENSEKIHQTLLVHFEDIRRRNDAMLFKNMPKTTLAKLNSTVLDIQLLNTISSATDMDSVSFFTGVSDDSSAFSEKLDILLTWSITPLQFGDHRPYAAATLLRIWRNKSEERAVRRDITSPDEILQDQLFDWLDESIAAGEEENLGNIARLFGKLVKDELFEYARYVQRLVARGEPGLSYTEGVESRHRKFMRCIPLHHSTSALVSQRKVTLHGARARQTPEDCNEREIRKELRAVLPLLFGEEARANYTSSKALLNDCPSLLSASRFEQVRIFRQWLLPIFRKAADSHDHSPHSNLLQNYCVVIELMTQTKCYGSVLELNLFMLQHASTMELLTSVIETFHRYAIIWTCMHSAATITAALYSSHQVARARGIQSRALLAMVMEFDNDRHLDAVSREHVASDIAAFTHALHPDSEAPCTVPSVLPEILLLSENPSPEAPAILANSLWYKYRTAFDWAWKVWDNTVASLRQVPVMTSEVSGRQACAFRYGRFLLHVDQHLPRGIDDHVLQWLLGTGKSEVSALNADAWDVLSFVLLFLVTHGALSVTTILHGLVYPAWQRGANAKTQHEMQLIDVLLRAVNNLVDRLLLRDENEADGTPPFDLLEEQRIRTRHHNVYQEPHFSLLVTSFPIIVLIENNQYIPEDLAQQFHSLRISLCKAHDFRQGAHRSLEAVRNAFEKSLLTEVAGKDVSDLIVDALQLILSDSSSDLPGVGVCDWKNISSLLSPWRIAATAILLQFTLRQMGRMLAQEATHQAASECLDQLTANIFHHSMTSEEAYFVAEMARGVEGAIAAKFINNGVQCMSEILRKSSASVDPVGFANSIERVGQLLRVLAHVAQSIKDDAEILPQLDVTVQNEFIGIFRETLDDIESIVAPSSRTELEAEKIEVSLNLTFLLRLLHFNLGLRGAWTAQLKSDCGKLASTLLRLAVYFASGDHSNIANFPIIIDTLYYLVDEIPVDPKVPTLDPFRHYPALSVPELSADIPPHYRNQLLSILPLALLNPTVSNLVTAYRDSLGQLVPGPAVLNRPWEWIENLGDHSIPDPKSNETGKAAALALKNSASISLDLFNARATGDGVVAVIGDDPRIEANIRSFEDGLSSESIFKRDWRETRAELDDDVVVGGGINRAEEVDEVGGLPSFSRAADRRSTSRSRITSPVSATSARSHHSMIPSVGGSSARSSPRNPPLQPPPLPRSSNSSASEPIDVDALTNSTTTTRQTSKRKMSTSDDEIEIVEGPTSAHSRAGKRPKGSTTTKKGR